MSPPNRVHHLNFVFQGGGVRGIAYAGALDQMPPWCKIHGVGGTSAGALAAALLAIGMRGSELKTVLSDKALFELLPKADVERTARLKQAASRVTDIVRGLAASEKTPGRPRVIRHAMALARIAFQRREDIRSVWRARGLHDSGPLRAWLDLKLGPRTFDDVVNLRSVDDLRIVAANLDEGSYRVFCARTDGGRPIAEAVHASISIPLFFVPFEVGGRLLVDGGLVSNFPSFLFAQSSYPTVGFRLQDIPPLGGGSVARPSPRSGQFQYLQSLVTTMLEAHDKFREPPENFSAFPINTPTHIGSTKFDLTEGDVAQLFEAGRAAGASVGWERVAAVEPALSVYDNRPVETLRIAMRVGQRVRESYYEPENWVERLETETTYRVRVTADYTAQYLRRSRYVVHGSRPLVVSQHKAFGLRKGGHLTSVTDAAYRPNFFEITNGNRTPLNALPISSDEDEKGFLLFYLPPVVEGQEREFESSFEIPQEFARTLGEGLSDKLEYATRRLAKEQRFALTFRVEIDASLGAFDVRPDFGAPARQPTMEDVGGVVHRVWEYSLRGEVVGRQLSTVSLRRSP